MKRDFLTLLDFSPAELETLIEQAIALKRVRHTHRPLVGRTLAMIFEKSSTRTRVSYEAGMAQLGGHALPTEPHPQTDPLVNALHVGEHFGRNL